MFRKSYQILTPERLATLAERRRRRARIAAFLLLGMAAAGAAAAAAWRLRPEPAQPTNTTQTIDISGQDRPYHVHLPPGYTGREPLPVVLVLHGLTQSVDSVRAMTGFDALADEQNFIVVYPEGFIRAWEVDDVDYMEVDDIAFINAILDRLADELAVDTQRIYATGFSMGGHMINRLACELPDRIAAFGAVAGIMSTRLAATCSPTRPVPIAMIHGTADRSVPYERTYDAMLGVAETLDFWLEHNGCDPNPALEDLPDSASDGTRVTQATYSGCDAGVAVMLVTVEGGGHTWPGGLPLDVQTMGRTSQDFSASAALWEFFRRFRLP